MSIICAHFIRSRLATPLGGLLGEASSKGFPKILYYSVPGRGISGLLRFGHFQCRSVGVIGGVIPKT